MFEASFHFTLSSKDNQMLMVSGHECYLKRKNKTRTNWNCSKYQTHKCRATAITDGENTIKESEKIEKVDELCLYFGSNYMKSLVPKKSRLVPKDISYRNTFSCDLSCNEFRC